MKRKHKLSVVNTHIKKYLMHNLTRLKRVGSVFTHDICNKSTESLIRASKETTFSKQILFIRLIY